MIFKRVGEEKPYPEHGLTHRQWAQIAPRQVRLDQLVTTRRDGKAIYYSLASDDVRRVISVIYDIFCNPPGPEAGKS